MRGEKGVGWRKSVVPVRGIEMKTILDMRPEVRGGGRRRLREAE